MIFWGFGCWGFFIKHLRTPFPGYPPPVSTRFPSPLYPSWGSNPPSQVLTTNNCSLTEAVQAAFCSVCSICGSWGLLLHRNYNDLMKQISKTLQKRSLKQSIGLITVLKWGYGSENVIYDGIICVCLDVAKLTLKPTLKITPPSNHKLASYLRRSLCVLINEQELLILTLLLNQRSSQLSLRAAVPNG